MYTDRLRFENKTGDHWGVCGYGLDLRNIDFSKAKLDKLFESRELYEDDLFEIGQKMLDILEEDVDESILSLIQNEDCVLFYYDFDVAFDEEDMFLQYYIDKLLIETTRKVSNMSPEEIKNHIEIVRTGGI